MLKNEAKKVVHGQGFFGVAVAAAVGVAVVVPILYMGLALIKGFFGNKTASADTTA